MAAKKKVSGMGNPIVSQDRSWQAEGDLNTLLAAEEIREDKARMSAVRALAKEKLVDMKKISVMADDKPESGDNDKGK